MSSQKEQRQAERPEILLSDLQLLQYRIKRGAEHYIPEMIKIINEFKVFFIKQEKFTQVQQNPSAINERFIEIILFLLGVMENYKDNLDFFPNYLIELLDNYAEQLNPKIRLKIVTCIIGIRNKNLIQPIQSITAFLKLLRVQHKELRKIVSAHIVNDIKRLNQKSKNIAVNKQVQNLIQNIINTSTNISLAKRSLQIAIQLYKKHIWNDAKAINIIASGMMSHHYKLILISANFLIQSTEIQEPDSESEDDFKTKFETRGSKNTRSKEARQDREKKKQQKRERKKNNQDFQKNFMPIDQIYNPQDFVEKIFSKINNSQKFEVKMAIMSVISRMTFRHKLILLSFYSMMVKYLTPNQRDIGRLLLYFAESVHEDIPVEELQHIIKHIIDQFIGEHCVEDKFVMGINTIREICFKNDKLITSDQLNYIADFSNSRERNVNQAAKSLINYYRDSNPNLLDKRHKGRFTTAPQEAIIKSDFLHEKIQGADLLKEDGQFPIYMERVLDDQDFKKIRQLQRKKREYEEQKRQEELQRLREIKLVNLNEEQEEDYDQSEISEDIYDSENEEEYDDEIDQDDNDEEDNDEEEYDEENEEEFEDDEENEEEEDHKNKNKIQQNIKKTQKSVLQKRKQKPLDQNDESSEEQSEDANPHGFIQENAIMYFRKTKSQQKKELKEKKLNEPKEKKYSGPKEKGGGTTNKQKQKNKNLLMLRPKKNKEKLRNKQVDSLKNRINQIKNQLGHVRSGKEAARRKKLKV